MVDHQQADPLPDDGAALPGCIARALNPLNLQAPWPDAGGFPALPSVSAVLFLLGPYGHRGSTAARPCLILNKRSPEVKQPGDLCCPGGGIAARIDGALARLLRLPGTPLTRWPLWRRWRRRQPAAAGRLALLMAAGLREAFEEMRLNPLRVSFLGPLPVQQLVMFQRAIYPLACWVPRQRRYVLNWEVDKVVAIPLAALLDRGNYARLRLTMPDGGGRESGKMDFESFVHRDGDEDEILWGATFRITMAFLKQVFDFQPPPADCLPVVRSRLDDAYLSGSTSPPAARIKKG